MKSGYMHYNWMGKMLNILWIMMLCMCVVAQSKKFTEEEAKAIIDCICKIHAHEMDSENYCSSKYSSRVSSSERCGMTPLKYVESAIQATQYSSESSCEWSTTENSSREYEKRQIVESEEYAQANHAAGEPQADQPSGHTIRMGSIPGSPNINFPDYKDIPLTSFKCPSKVHFPGFYADMETGCQVFHVCWPDRRESFLCPIGTIFNQAILACDYWYKSDCSLAAHYGGINAASFQTGTEYKDSAPGSMVDVLIEEGYSQSTQTKNASKIDGSDLSYILKFLPVKAEVFIYQNTPETRSNIFAEANVEREREPKTEEMKPKYILVQRKETSDSKVITPEIKSKHDDITVPVNRVIAELFDITKEILGELGYRSRSEFNGKR